MSPFPWASIVLLDGLDWMGFLHVPSVWEDEDEGIAARGQGREVEEGFNHTGWLKYSHTKGDEGPET